MDTRLTYSIPYSDTKEFLILFITDKLDQSMVSVREQTVVNSVFCRTGGSTCTLVNPLDSDIDSVTSWWPSVTAAVIKRIKIIVFIYRGYLMIPEAL